MPTARVFLICLIKKNRFRRIFAPMYPPGDICGCKWRSGGHWDNFSSIFGRFWKPFLLSSAPLCKAFMRSCQIKKLQKNTGFCIKNDIFVSLTSIQNYQKNGLRRRSGSTSKTMIKKRRIRCHITSHFGAKIGPSSLQNRSEN